MKVVVTTESRFARTPDGQVWSTTAQDHTFWSRYLAVFPEVTVVARVLDVDIAPADSLAVLGPRVKVWAVPHYLGPTQYLRRRRHVVRSVRSAVGPNDAVIIRAPSPLGTLLTTHLEMQDRPYGVEVVGDPHAVFAPGVLKHPLRPFLRWRYTAALRRQCLAASCASYVTGRHLQAKYPVSAGRPQFVCSSAALAPEAYRDAPRPTPATPGTLHTVSVGSLEQRYKGIDTIVQAVALLAEQHRDVRHVHVGDGRFRDEIQSLAVRLGVSDRITFVGAVPPGAAVRSHLDAADLFLLPSRTEGLPRAVIEAMARGLPAIGSDVGGIPELLPAQYLVKPDSPTELAAAIAALQDDPEAMVQAGVRNREVARGYAADSLAQSREAFYRSLARATWDEAPVVSQP